MKGMFRTGFNVMRQPPLKGLEDVVLSVDDEVVDSQNAGQQLRGDVHKLRLLGNKDELMLDERATFELYGNQAISLGHGPVIEDICIINDADDALLYSLGRQVIDGFVTAVDVLQSGIERVHIGVREGEAAARTKRWARIVRPGDFAGMSVTSRKSRMGGSSKRRSVLALAERKVPEGGEAMVHTGEEEAMQAAAVAAAHGQRGTGKGRARTISGAGSTSGGRSAAPSAGGPPRSGVVGGGGGGGALMTVTREARAARARACARFQTFVFGSFASALRHVTAPKAAKA
ncbi:hypothetical protein FGB62_24g226 [Gracilaria domingensis]|nr:hypothetical protein FGB62_24g226 [Gracilaria domingensis]